jgi:O-antigen ligase
LKPSNPASAPGSDKGLSGLGRRALAADLPVDPLVIAAGLGISAVLAATLLAAGLSVRTAERVTAAVFVLLSAGLVGRGAVNGVVLLFLVPPVFNGEDFRRYFPLLQGLLVLTLARTAVSHLAARRPLRAPGWPFLALFCGAAVLALPLDGRALWLELQLSPWRDVLRVLVGSELWTRLHYAHVVLDILAGAALYVVVASQEWPRERLLRLSIAVAAVQVAVVAVGLWHYRVNPWPGASFLTAWVGGRLTTGFTGFGFNVSYFGQYATAYLPLAGLALVEGAPAWARGVAFGALALGSVAILLTGQVGAFVVLGMVLVLLLAVGRRLRGTASARWPALTAAVAVLLWAGLLAFWFSPVAPGATGRLAMKLAWGDSLRMHLLGVAWRIFREEPLLGIGSGRFYDLFRFYTTWPDLQFATWSMHYLYLQFLVEQGGLGLLGFSGLVAVVLTHAVRAVWRRSAPPAAVFLLVSLTGWLVYGLFQYTFLMRAMQCYFWIALGLLAGLTYPPRPPRRVPAGRWWLAAGVAALVLLGVRLHTLGQWPIVPAWGLHRPEGGFRWTQGGAWFALPVEGRTLRLTLAGPDPRWIGRPQDVRVRLDGVPVARLRLDQPGWRTVDIPVNQPAGTPVRVEIGVAYSFVPAALRLNADTRRLGVMLQPVQWLKS